MSSYDKSGKKCMIYDTRMYHTVILYGNYFLDYDLCKIYDISLSALRTHRYNGELAHNMLIYCQEIILMSLNLTKCED